MAAVRKPGWPARPGRWCSGCLRAGAGRRGGTVAAGELVPAREAALRLMKSQRWLWGGADGTAEAAEPPEKLQSRLLAMRCRRNLLLVPPLIAFPFWEAPGLRAAAKINFFLNGRGNARNPEKGQFFPLSR